ncbi:hypothetical protein ASD04_16190 [Devosia sp. Root436]|jgi:hypothetical protein|uniref:tripartite tricarboxylate transporter TctB family protein n=1 Tax=Devosia sp. Root436 TaxID=1736537 RepID=UPI0006F5C4A2|nr:tripartite tricarboxylate transporter TctB family protein [Devosia sp. Root436]KQX34919.1 hypothetical protein ASD04_16190 [Devosia sp. Root436]
MSGRAEYKPGGSAFASEILQRKDFWSAVLYVTLGIGTIIASLGYEFGSPSNMGPGFFPIILGAMLAIIGGVIAIRVFTTTDGNPDMRLGFINWKALALVSGSTVLFALLLPYSGVLIALPALMLVGAAASRHFRIELRAVAGMLVLSAACALVFVVGLGVPMPLLGSLFGG